MILFCSIVQSGFIANAFIHFTASTKSNGGTEFLYNIGGYGEYGCSRSSLEAQ